MSSGTNQPFGVRRNVGTCVGQAAVPFGVAAPEPPPDPDTAYRFAVSAERARASREPFVGHRLYWMTGGTIGACDLVSDEGFLVVGRHTHADVVLDRDARISLRHLMVRSMPLADAEPMLSVFDLSSELGFRLVDGTLQRNIVARGPVVLSVGSYALVALPAGPPPARLPAPEIVPVESSAARSPGAHPYRSPLEPRVGRARESLIGLMPRLLDLAVESSRALPPTSAIPMSVAPPSEAPVLELEVRSPRGSERVLLSRAELARGVLLGRSPKCASFGFSRVLATTTSRVHALLLETRTGLQVFDTASSHGIYDVHGSRWRSMPLDGPVSRFRLGLAGDVDVVLRRL